MQGLIDKLYRKKWVVFAAKPFANPRNLLRYLGRYANRVALSSSRILDYDDRFVYFRYEDYADGNKLKVMKLTGEEFIRRFLLHILPRAFVKILHSVFCQSRAK